MAASLEGSRFVGWLLYRLAAGGSRELPGALQLCRVRIERPRRNRCVG
jgi:hypothetical protein